MNAYEQGIEDNGFASIDNITYALKTEGFEVIWCSTAEEATKVFSGNNIDLIVLDVGLPDKNGFDLCRDIREIALHGGI